MSIKWRDNWEIGVKEIDKQHKALVEQVANLLNACKDGRSKQEISNTLNFLSQYVKEHFHYEEEQHKKFGYPNSKSHANLHNSFTKEVQKLQDQFQSEGVSLQFTIQLNRKVVNWLINHIGRVDQKFGKFLEEKS